MLIAEDHVFGFVLGLVSCVKKIVLARCLR